ncbi:arylsulfatase B-like isoform X2 [Epargyreus clarus]
MYFSRLHWLLLILNISAIAISDAKSNRPNIVLIIADDMGWNDVSFHGSDQIMTPNIDLLAYSGVALERYYTHCVCTPSRSALYTGKFAHALGMQGYPLTNGEDRALPLTEKILPQYLKDLGYATHLVGKWHVGHSRNEYLPTFRGFDTHFGHRCGYIDYYEYTSEETWPIGDVAGLDFYRNMTVDWESNKYVTDLYSEEAVSIIKNHKEANPLFLTVAHNAPHSGNAGAPLQAPAEEVRKMRHVESPERRIFAAMVKKLDDSVGDIVKALLEKGILENTIIAFVSDNGGMTSGSYLNYASNWPLRGLKMSPFEGGIRVNGLIWSKNLSNSGSHSWSGYMHAVDWVPTLLKAVGAEPPPNIDGVDLWESITANTNSKRDLIFEIDDYSGFASIISGDYKLLTGKIEYSFGTHQGQSISGIIGSGPSYKDTLIKSTVYSVLKEIDIDFKMKDTKVRDQSKINCSKVSDDLCFPDKENEKICLFNIKEDPCETQDLSATYPHIVKIMKERLQKELQRTIPRTIPYYSDPRAAPALHNFTWTTWINNPEP